MRLIFSSEELYSVFHNYRYKQQGWVEDNETRQKVLINIQFSRSLGFYYVWSLQVFWGNITSVVNWREKIFNMCSIWPPFMRRWASAHLSTTDNVYRELINIIKRAVKKKTDWSWGTWEAIVGKPRLIHLLWKLVCKSTVMFKWKWAGGPLCMYHSIQNVAYLMLQELEACSTNEYAK